MVSVVIINNQEPNVIQYTFEQLYSELKDITGSELLIRDKWDITDVRNRFVCFVEADCLVSPHYFQNQLAVFKKMSPRVAVLAPSTAVKHWENKIYGYTVDGINSRVMPNRKQKVNFAHPIQVAYIPGSIIRVSCLKKVPLEKDENLVDLSSRLSIKIWKSGLTIDAKHPDGQLSRQIYLNPTVTYVTTEEYVNDITDYKKKINSDLFGLFAKESV